MYSRRSVLLPVTVSIVLVLASRCEAQSDDNSRKTLSIVLPAVLVSVFSAGFTFVWIFLCIFIRKSIKRHRLQRKNRDFEAQPTAPMTGYIDINQTNIHTGEEHTLTAGGQPSSTDVNTTVFNSTHFHPTAPPPEVLTQQVDTHAATSWST